MTSDEFIFIFFLFSAAHCIQKKGRSDKQDASDIIAIFGAHNLTDEHEANKLSLTPELIRIHEDWNPNIESFDADIAMLTFKAGNIKNTMFIKPVCLWKEEEEEEEQLMPDYFESNRPFNTKVPKENGTVTGWGQSQHLRKSEFIPTELLVPIQTNEFCFSRNHNLQRLSSRRTICAGAGDGSGICFGDSGGSLVVEVESTFYFRGIISSSMKNRFHSCDVETYQIYTDVLQYLRWIKNRMKQVVCRIITRGDWDGERNEKICIIDDQLIDEEGFTIDNDFDEKFLSIQFYEKKINFLPEYVAKTFPNLFVYQAPRCALKHISEKCFDNLNKLGRLLLSENKIESIASDAFKDLKELEDLQLMDNKIKVVDPKWFQFLSKLKWLNMKNNEIENLDANTFENLINLEYLYLNSNKLTSIPGNLIEKNSELLAIDLSDNQIKVINPDMFDQLLKLYSINLENNDCVNRNYESKWDFQSTKEQLNENCQNDSEK